MNKLMVQVGVSISGNERQAEDYYATEPKATKLLLEVEGGGMSKRLLEPCCGEGHISKVLINEGFEVVSRDLIDRNYGDELGVDFLTDERKWNGDIVMNPPYKMALEFIEHGLEIIPQGQKVYAFLRLLFLEGKKRRELFDTGQLQKVYVSSKRLLCAKNGDFEKLNGSAVAYAWFVFVKGRKGPTTIEWIN